MNVVKKYVIPYKGLDVGNHSFEFEIGGDFFGKFEENEILSGDLKAEVNVTKGNNMMEISIVIDGQVGVECDRCLDECSMPIEYEGGFIVRVSETVDDFDGEVMWISPMHGDVDLTQYIYESIALSLPYQRVHGEDDAGNSLCNTEMLERFKIVTQQEFEALAVSPEDKQQRETQWAKLKELKEEL